MKISHQDLLVSGDEIGDTSDSCYFGIFKSSLNQKAFAVSDKAIVSKLWSLGTIILKHYYIVLDATPYDETGNEYIQVGIAPINPVNNIAAS